MTASLIHTSRGTPLPSLDSGVTSKSRLLLAFGKRKRLDTHTEQRIEPHATLLVGMNALIFVWMHDWLNSGSAPISLLTQWQSELDRSSKPGTLRTLIWHGLHRANLAEALGPQPAGERPVDVVITSYGTLSSEYANVEKGKSSQVYDSGSINSEIRESISNL